MIWFKCKSCGKTLSRADSLVGTMIFCACGQGITVPWNSTAPEVSLDSDEIPVLQQRAIPILIEEEEREARPAQKLPPTPPTGEALPQKKRRTHKRNNPAYCFNHDELGSETVCDDCKLSFCNACVVDFQGYILCGPCKNFRLRPRAAPKRLASWAIVALVVGLVSTPLGFCISALPLTARLQGQGSPGLTVVALLLALVPAGAACWLGRFALRQLDREPLLAGRGLAYSGLLAGVLGAVWTVTVSILTFVRQLQGG